MKKETLDQVKVVVNKIKEQIPLEERKTQIDERPLEEIIKDNFNKYEDERIEKYEDEKMKEMLSKLNKGDPR